MINTGKVANVETVINKTKVEKKEEKIQKNITVVFNQKTTTSEAENETFDTFIKYVKKEFNPDSVIYHKTTKAETNDFPPGLVEFPKVDLNIEDLIKLKNKENKNEFDFQPGLVEFPGVDINIKLKNKINENEFDIPPLSKEEKIYYNIIEKVDNIVETMSKVLGLGDNMVSYEIKGKLFESLLKIFLVANGFNPNYRPPMINY